MNIKEAALENRLRILIILIGIFFVSFSGLVLQITITRIFSTAIWYHYAFVAISVALFGWGLGGVFLQFLGRRLRLRALDLSPVIALIFSFSIPIYVWAILQFPMSPSYINFYYVASTVPFLVGGIFMALLFDNFAHLANKVYFADLAGASLACLSVEPLLGLLGAESTALMLGMTASVAGLSMSLVSRKRKLLAICLIGLAINSSIFLNNVQHSSISISTAPSKLMFHLLGTNPELHLVLTRWNSFSRIDVVEGKLPEHELASIFIDADASTSVLKWDGRIESAQYLKATIDFLPYYLVNEPKTLIIGSGGGKDVIISLVGESSKVVAVELNPIIVQVTRNYGEKAGNVYNHDKVEVVVDEGRSFISRSKEKYDVIVLKLVDSWAAISAGGYALAENYLYTLEAFKQYLDHLTDDGVLVMVRWDREVPRLVLTAVKALQARGKTIQEAGRHIAIILRECEPGTPRGVLSLFMLKKNPLSIGQAEEIRDRTLALGSNYQVCYIPYLYGLEPYFGLFNGTISLDQFYADYPLKIEPVTDDNPYYFCFEKPIPEPLSNLIKLTSLLAVAFVAVPWIFKRKRATKHSKGTCSFIIYFSALGLAYILLEVALIQKFILLLGYPTRALSTILFSLLLSSGIGSFVSGRIGKRSPLKNILLACAVIMIIVASYVSFLPSLFAILFPQDTTVRTIFTTILLFPLGFFMGIPFPTGLRILNSFSNQNIPWMWGVNGAMSVFGSVLATTIGIIWGFNYAIAMGAAAYFIALLCAWYWQDKTS